MEVGLWRLVSGKRVAFRIDYGVRLETPLFMVDPYARAHPETSLHRPTSNLLLDRHRPGAGLRGDCVEGIDVALEDAGRAFQQVVELRTQIGVALLDRLVQAPLE